MSGISRRGALGLGVATTATAVLGTGTATAQDGPDKTAPRTPETARRWIAHVYRRETERAGGNWQALISLGGVPAVDTLADDVVEAYSVNKVAVAIAVLDKVDRGLLTLDQRLEVTSAIVLRDGDGIFGFDGAYPSSVTIGHALAALVTVSDNTSVRLAGLICPPVEINQIIAAKGFPKTQVVPAANPNRFYLGKTTARETHDLFTALVAGTLLSPASTEFLLAALRAPIAFTDGVRRTMSSVERGRIATKAGWFYSTTTKISGRNEAGIVFGASGAPILTYSIFANGQADPENFGATHPAVQARSVIGRNFLDATAHLESPTARAALGATTHQPSNGG